MSTIDEAVYGYLANLGGPAGDRFYPVILPEGVTYPAATVTMISLVPDYVQEGESGFQESRMQFEALGEPEEAKTLADWIRAQVSGRKFTASGVTVYCGYLEGGPMDFDETLRKWRIVQDYLLEHNNG